MALESATYINGLVSSNPTGTDDRSSADDHLRLIKRVLKATFPNISGVVNIDQNQLNALTGIVGDVQTELSGNAADLADLEVRVDALELSVSAINTVVASLQTTVSTNTSRVGSLSASVAALESTANSLGVRVTDLESSVASTLPQGTIYGGRVDASATAILLPSGWTATYVSSGRYSIVHNLGATVGAYAIIVTPALVDTSAVCANVFSVSQNSFEAHIKLSDNTFKDSPLSFMIMKAS